MKVDGISGGLSSRIFIGTHSTLIRTVNPSQAVSNKYQDAVTLSPQARELYKSNGLQKINGPIPISTEDITNIISSASKSGKNVKIFVTPDSCSIDVTYPPIQDSMSYFVRDLLVKVWSSIFGK